MKVPIHEVSLRVRGEVTLPNYGIVRDSSSAAKVARAFWEDEHPAEERALVICLDDGDPAKVLGFEEIGRGSTMAVTFEPVSVLRTALLCGSNQYIFVHTHPVGADITPSRSDEELTHEPSRKQLEDLLEKLED